MDKSLKKRWGKPDLEIIVFEPQDIITQSIPGGSDGKNLPFDPW